MNTATKISIGILTLLVILFAPTLEMAFGASPLSHNGQYHMFNVGLANVTGDRAEKVKVMQWNGDLDRLIFDHNGGRYAMWQAVKNKVKAGVTAESLFILNVYFNALPYVEEETDTWNDPEHFMLHGGDCEEFAMIKYHALRSLGVPTSDMMIIAVDDNGIGHAILAVSVGGEWLYLDVKVNEVATDATLRFNYTPQYGITGNQFKVFIKTKEK